MAGRQFTFLACVNDEAVAARSLLQSPCLAAGTRHQLLLARGMPNAGTGFAWGSALANHDWLVFVHQDVWLPAGWSVRFAEALDAAVGLNAELAVVGVYGVLADGSHVGRVLDRGQWLGEVFSEALPVRALDEMLVAVRLDSALRVDPTLGWHLWATDLCLQAHADGKVAAALCAPCDHQSSLPRDITLLQAESRQRMSAVVDAFNLSAAKLMAKWPLLLPLTTPVATLDTGFRIELPAGPA